LFLAFVTNFRVECGISAISNDSLWGRISYSEMVIDIE
jgi:hypothetical protein